VTEGVRAMDWVRSITTVCITDVMTISASEVAVGSIFVPEQEEIRKAINTNKEKLFTCISKFKPWLSKIYWIQKPVFYCCKRLDESYLNKPLVYSITIGLKIINFLILKQNWIKLYRIIF
jgi:hypothetical protein